MNTLKFLAIQASFGQLDLISNPDLIFKTPAMIIEDQYTFLR